MPDLPDNIDSFQEEDMEDAINKKKEEPEDSSNVKEELWLFILPRLFILTVLFFQHNSFRA